MYILRQTRRFKKDFKKLEKRKQVRILEKLSLLAAGRWKQLDLQKLKGSRDSYRLKSGDYRIWFEEMKTELVIILVSVRHRKESYR